MCEVSSSSIVTKRPLLGRLSYCLDGAFDFSLKIHTKARSFFFVIRYSIPEFYLSLVQNSGWGHHRYLVLISANTSSEDRPDALPSRTIWTRR